MKVYSPSSTLTFQRCPQLWHWRRKGWSSKVIGKPDVAAAVGLGIAHGLEKLFKGIPLDEAVQLARGYAYADMAARMALGASLLPSVEQTYTLVSTRVEKALRRFWKEKPLPSDWSDFIPELTFPDHGNCRVDLLHNSDLGPCITDFKTKVTAAEYIVDNFLFDAESSWQMYHYVWAARQMGIEVKSFSIVLIVIEPFHVYPEQYMVDEAVLMQWARDAQRWWQLMEMVETDQLHPLRAGDHRDKYGLCSHYKMCYNHSNEEEAKVDFIQRERV